MTNTPTPNDHAAILELWMDYREGIYGGDVGRLTKIFHPSASMFFISGTNLAVTPIAAYLDVVKNRIAPKVSSADRDERLISLAQPAPDSAVLTATILISNKHYTDQLTLMKEKGSWLIVSKTYHLNYDRNAEQIAARTSGVNAPEVHQQPSFGSSFPSLKRSIARWLSRSNMIFDRYFDPRVFH